MKKNRKSKICVMMVFVLLIMSTVVFAWMEGYFNTKSEIDIDLGKANTIIRKEKSGSLMQTSIENTGTGPCFIRVKIFTPSSKAVTITSSSEKWEQHEDGYWYYSEILHAQKVTDKLNIQGNNNAIVIQETTQDYYEENGKIYADWERVYSVGNGGN